MNVTSRSMLGVSLIAMMLGYGCAEDSGEEPDGRAGRGGSAGAGSGGKAGKGGSAGRGGSAGTGGSSTPNAGSAGESAGAAGEAASSGGAGGEEATAGAGGETAGAGGEAATAGAGGEGTTAGAGGEGATAGAGGAGEEDPRCTEVPVDATVTSHLKITADNECDVYVNGEPVGSTSNWGAAVTIDVSLYVHPGRKNVVAVVGRNTSSQGGNDRGIVGELTTTVGESLASLIVTNDEWRVSQDPGDGWTLLDYDDSSWRFASEIATVGDPPWGQVIANTDVKWIWFAPVPASTGDKPNLEATYARRVFFFDFDGAPRSEPLCNEPDL